MNKVYELIYKVTKSDYTSVVGYIIVEKETQEILYVAKDMIKDYVLCNATMGKNGNIYPYRGVVINPYDFTIPEAIMRDVDFTSLETLRDTIREGKSSFGRKKKNAQTFLEDIV